jgi:hypothetical protein
MVGALVRVPGVHVRCSAALAGTGGTGGASRAACSLAVMDSCESEAWRKRSMEKRRLVWAGRGEAEGDSCESRAVAVDGLATSLDAGRRPSSDWAMRSGVRYSVLLSSLSPLSLRRNRPAGSSVLLRFRSRSLFPARRRILAPRLQLIYAWVGLRRSAWHTAARGGIERRQR